LNKSKTAHNGNLGWDVFSGAGRINRTRSDESNRLLPFTSANLRSALFFLAFVFLLSFVFGAKPTSDAEECLRQGNVAFERNDFEAALSLYRQAEGRIADPGWLAFNEGAALYRLGRYRDAEIHYWLSRQDALGPRQARVLFDLGNAVFRQAGSKDAAMLQRAIGFYEECLNNPNTESDLADNARHNLALAREMLKRSKASSPIRPEEKNQVGKPAEDLNPEASPNRTRSTSESEEGAGSGRHPAEGLDQEDGSTSKKSTHRPGVGNLPPITDLDQLAPLNPRDTSAYLQQAADRILKERRSHYGKSVVRPSQNFKDW
jgi:tetratricopeptide (TPR) repeat protein